MFNNQTELNQQNQVLDNSDIKLISHALCPFVQRSVILLTEQNTPFERVDIDLANKPDWFNRFHL